ncbi:MAG: hypothetical protein V1856_01485 [Candidatus Liptonbacteria bacterium]
MSPIFRRALFYLLFLAFLLLGAAATLYAMGYRLDRENMSLTTVGGLYVRSYPPDTTIRLNGKEIKNKSGLFSDGTFVSGLFPQSYRLTLVAPLYRAWQRDITVAPSLVTEIKRALLIPEIIPEAYPGGAEEFWPVGEKLAVLDAEKGLVLASSTLPGEKIIGTSRDGRIIFSKDDMDYYWFDAKTATGTAMAPVFARTGFAKPKSASLDRESGQVIIRTADGVATLEVPTRMAQTIFTFGKSGIPENIISSRSWLAWYVFDAKEDLSRIFLYDKIAQKDPLEIAEFAGRISQMAWSPDERLGILDEGGEFYVYSAGDDFPTRIASDGKFFRFSADGSRVAIFENKSLEIFTFREEDEYWRFNIPDSAKIKEAWWHADDWHLIFAYPGRTVLLDLEDKALQGLETLVDTDASIFQSETGFLYYLRDGKVYRMDLSGE